MTLNTFPFSSNVVRAISTFAIYVKVPTLLEFSLKVVFDILMSILPSYLIKPLHYPAIILGKHGNGVINFIIRVRVYLLLLIKDRAFKSYSFMFLLDLGKR